MSHEPKKRHSRQRQGKRRAHITLALAGSTICAQCGAQIMPHRVCPQCGFYKGKQVIKVETPTIVKRRTVENA